MTVDYSMASRTEMLAGVVRRLHAEYPEMAGDQVVRCVQVARESAKTATGLQSEDPTALVNVVETQARNYLAKLQAIRSGSPLPPNPTVVELGAAERRRPGRHRRDASASRVGGRLGML
jgi:hypothetical protein